MVCIHEAQRRSVNQLWIHRRTEFLLVLIGFLGAFVSYQCLDYELVNCPLIVAKPLKFNTRHTIHVSQEERSRGLVGCKDRRRRSSLAERTQLTRSLQRAHDHVIA